jgi:4-hydroxy-2-oxoheptanedioate aldolase
MGGIGSNKIAHNPVKYNLHHGLPAIGTWISLCSPASAESMARVGWDWLVIDVQHSPVGFDTMVNSFRAAQLGGAVPMARVPWNDIVWMQRILDAGALGLVIPMVNSAEDAEKAVANTKYGGSGIRSFTSGRISSYADTSDYGGDYTDWANDNIAVIPMIETVQAVKNAEAILSVEGVDGCFIGPRDLAISMGVKPHETGPGGEHEAMMMSVLEAGKKVGTAVGKHCDDADEVNERIAQGFQFLALASDAGMMIKMATSQFKAVRRP